MPAPYNLQKLFTSWEFLLKLQQYPAQNISTSFFLRGQRATYECRVETSTGQGMVTATALASEDKAEHQK